MAEAYIVKMPQLSDTMSEGVLVSWEKKEGDRIQRGDIIATVETDKAIMDVEVFRDGYLSGPLTPVDTSVPVGEAIAYIVETAEEVGKVEANANAGATPSPRKEAAPEPDAFETTAALVAPSPSADAYVIKMPQLSDTMSEGVLVAWNRQPGEKIARGDIVAQVETDKAIMDVEVFRDGYLSGPLAPVDSTVAVGEPIGYLVESADQVNSDVGAAAPKKAAAPVAEKKSAAAPAQRSEAAAPESGDVTPAQRPANKPATPYARQLAASLNVNLNTLKGSGPDGEITADDVRRAQPVARPTEIAPPLEPEALPHVQVPGHGRPMNAMERAVSASMTASLTMPTFHVTINARPDALIQAAKQARVSVTVAIAKACAEAIAQHPTINWAYQPVEKLVERDQVDIGMAVTAEGGGLVVPVLRHCESRSLDELNSNWKDLVERARKRRLAPEEYANPSFMISNMGMFGITWFDAIPTPGTAAILAIAAAGSEGMPLTVTADHRVVNGAEVASFLNTLKGLIEQPASWMASAAGPLIPPGEWDYDVVVIGGGPGGEDCARDLVAHGLKVALVNDAPFPGGECLWRGCIPSKAWRAAADRIRDRAHDGLLGVNGTNQPILDWAALEAHRRGVLEERGKMAQNTDKGVKIKLVQGFAHFESDHRLFVDTSRNSEDPHRRSPQGDQSQGEHISFGCAVIATGAPAFVPSVPGAHEGLAHGGVLTSDTVWHLPGIPRRLGIIGGGAIGMEMAQIFQDFGTEVLLLERSERILAEVEPEIAKQLTAVLEQEPRLHIKTNAAIQGMEGQAGAMLLRYQDIEGEQTFECDYVLMATGKRPVLEPLQLDKAGVAVEKGMIRADTRCRTSVPHIYAVGDVIGGLMLAHTAAQQGRVAAATILGEEFVYEQNKDSGVIFTRPEAGFVGLSLEQAKAQGIDAAEIKVPMNIDAKAMITGEVHGMIKLVADKASERIIGVHLLADHTDTLIGEAVMMVSAGMTLQQVGRAIHPHPTQTELFGDLARRLEARLRRSKKLKK